MNRSKKFAQEHIYIFSFMSALISIGSLVICKSWIFKTSNDFSYDFNYILSYLFPLIIVFTACFLSGNINKIRFHKEGIGTGILYGWLIIVSGVYGFVSSYIKCDKSFFSFPSMQKIIFFTLVMLLIGIFEEVIIRGVILNNMLNKWGYTKAGMIKSVILSSLIFGLCHLVNLIGHPSLIITTLTQVMYSFLIGVLFASIYLRCKNIWAVIILHAIFDWFWRVSDIYHIIANPVTPVDISVALGLTISMLCIPFALVGFFLLRKAFVEDMHQYAKEIKPM